MSASIASSACCSFGLIASGVNGVSAGMPTPRTLRGMLAKLRRWGALRVEDIACARKMMRDVGIGRVSRFIEYDLYVAKKQVLIGLHILALVYICMLVRLDLNEYRQLWLYSAP